MILLIILCVFILAFIFHLATRKYLNPYKLYLVFGKKGSGKSTFLVKQALRYLKRGYTVYTNMDEISIPGVRWFNLNHLGDFVPPANSLLLLDEVGMVWDSRDFKKFRPEVRDFFKLQRHYHVLVYMASQTFDVDKKIRDLTDGMFLNINVLRVFSLGKKIYRKVVLTEASAEGESRISENLTYSPFWEWSLTYIPKYSKWFDSHHIPEKKELPYREIK